MPLSRNPVPLICVLASLGIVANGPVTNPTLAADPAASEPEIIVSDAHFRHGTDLLAGSLYCPRLPGRRPALALVYGSGAQDRRYGGAGTALARHFARHGYVVLTWDKPGIGKSTGDFNTQTFRDRAGEALAAVQFLRQRPEVQAAAVGLWAHSQGGMVAPLAASLSDQVAFVIQVAGWQGPVWRQDAVRVEQELRAGGFSAADIDEAVAFARSRMDLIRGSGPFAELEQAQAKVRSRPWFSAVHWCDRALFHAARLNADYDTAPSPVLAIYGDHDTSSGPPEPLVDVIRAGLDKAHNHDVTVRIFPGADHSLRAVQARDAKNQADFIPGYLDLMTDWLGQHYPPGP